ncbi:hypothetical protein BJ508DRAFT_331040 [Ascobolus immersus RN42]|uniref:Uncharacterized protein n=1 Tax=Ascobolus immersus RN42 TaxID=1160509 RepID=A0A3N4HXB8_ASCIM|nr:hypothetical protein BJ508DRAFT_331040 [Ascobolus immersus RN42]
MPFTSLPLELRGLIAEHIDDWKDHMAYRHANSSNYHHLTRFDALSNQFPISKTSRELLCRFRIAIALDPIFRLIVDCGRKGCRLKLGDEELLEDFPASTLKCAFGRVPLGVYETNEGRNGLDAIEESSQEKLLELIALQNHRSALKHLFSTTATYSFPPGFPMVGASPDVESSVARKRCWKRLVATLHRQIAKLASHRFRRQTTITTGCAKPAEDFEFGYSVYPSLGFVSDDAVESSLRKFTLQVLPTILEQSNSDLTHPLDNQYSTRPRYGQMIGRALQEVSVILRTPTSFADLPVCRFVWQYHAARKMFELADTASESIWFVDTTQLQATMMDAWSFCDSLKLLKMLFAVSRN